MGVLLISCRHDNTTSVKQVPIVQCIENVSTPDTVALNDIKIQILKLTDYQPRVGIPLSDVVVQLDHDGVCVKSNSLG